MAPTFLHKVATSKIEKGKKLIHEEELMDGDKGLTIKYFHKEDDNAVKIVIRQTGDEYKIMVTRGDQKEEQTVSKEDVVKYIKKDKNLSWAANYLSGKKIARSTGGKWAKSGSKKGSRK